MDHWTRLLEPLSNNENDDDNSPLPGFEIISNEASSDIKFKTSNPINVISIAWSSKRLTSWSKAIGAIFLGNSLPNKLNEIVWTEDSDIPSVALKRIKSK